MQFTSTYSHFFTIVIVAGKNNSNLVSFCGKFVEATTRCNFCALTICRVVFERIKVATTGARMVGGRAECTRVQSCFLFLKIGSDCKQSRRCQWCAVRTQDYLGFALPLLRKQGRAPFPTMTIEKWRKFEFRVKRGIFWNASRKLVGRRSMRL